MSKIRTFGEGREIMLNAMIALKENTLKAESAVAMAAMLQSINASINAEVNAAKMSILATKAGKDFGDVMKLGSRPIFDGELLE